MSRLPTPGQDNGTWGSILNDYLAQAHTSDGSLKAGSVGAAQVADSALPATKLDASAQASLAAVAGKYTKPGTGIPKTDLDATTQASLTKADGSLQASNNLSDVTAGTARTNLGLGTAATMTPATLAADSAFTGAYAPIGLDMAGISAADRNTNALRYFRSQLARRENTPVDIVCLGHSMVEGEGSTAMTKRWSDRLRDNLRTRFPVAGVTGGYGYIAVTTNSTTWNLNSYITLSGGASSGNYGLGKHSRFVNVAGATVTLTLNGLVASAIDVIYIRGGGGTFSTKTNNVSNADSVVTTGSPIAQVAYRIPAVTPSTTSVEVDYISGNSIICGFMIYNGDTTSGIRVWNDAQGGLTSAQMLDSTNVHMSGLDVAAPSLVVVTALANDFKTGVAAATSQANLTTIVSQIRVKAPNASIVFAVEHAMGATGAVIPWSDYVQAYYSAAAADGNVAVFDFYRRVGTSTPPTVPGIIAADQQHPTDAGYLMWSDAIASFLAP